MMEPASQGEQEVRHSISNPVALKTISRRVPEMFLQFQRIQAVITQAQPMMVMMERYISTFQPT